ncbi:MAG: cobalamin-binding protein [Phycisphaeraceae bacterium]|nr:MAG: cobalamin-binding protein [Phycisphaeraceae bacterium]
MAAMRVVSLLPSATEILCRIGGADLLVARSHECDFPQDILDRPMLTSQRTSFTTSAEVDRAVRDALGEGQGLYRLDGEGLRARRPDLILTQDLCEVCSVDLETVRRIAGSMDPSPEVLSLDPWSLEDVFDDMLRVGRALGREGQAGSAVVQLRERFHSAAECVNPYTDPVPVLFLEWLDPLFCGGHWTPGLIERAGGSHPLNPTRAREETGGAATTVPRAAGKSVRITPEQGEAVQPEAVILCPCGLDLETTRREGARLLDQAWFRDLPAFRQGKVALVDGSQMFNRPGPRLVDAFEWLVGWLNDRPELIPSDFPWEPLA